MRGSPTDEGGRDAARSQGSTAGASFVLEDTRRRILDAGLEVLRTVGHGQFSVQKVAQAAGVYQGNVTYYWPRRRDLVLALAVRIVEDSLRTFEDLLLDLDPASDGWATTVMGWLVDDAVSEERVRLLPELWSMANADEDIAHEVVRSFEARVDTVLARIGIDPSTPGGTELRRALGLAGLAAQGLAAVHGHLASDDARRGELRADLCALHVPALERARERATSRADT